MQQIMTCIEGVGDSFFCPSGYIPQLVTGYVLIADPYTFDPVIAGKFFSFGLVPVLFFYTFSVGIGCVLNLVKRG